MKKFLTLLITIGVVMIPFVGTLPAQASSLVPNSWPDTVASKGCANFGDTYRFMDAASPVTDWAPNPCGNLQTAGYTYSRSVTVTSTTSVASGTNANFPMLFQGTYTWLESTSTAGGLGRIQNLATAPNGGQEPSDLAFGTTPANCTANPLSYETESYTSSTGAIIDWVNVPSLSAGTVIYACYGASTITGDHSMPAGTWNSSYQLVYHLPNGTTANTNDSTVNANNGVIFGGPTATPGFIDGAVNFNGTGGSPYIFAGTNPDLLFLNTFTLSAWIKPANITTNGNGDVIGKDNEPMGGDRNYFFGQAPSSGELEFFSHTSTGTVQGFSSTGANLSTTNYTLVQVVMNNLNATFYANGLAVGTGTVSSLQQNASVPTLIGSSNGNYSFVGVIDEPEIISTALTPSWIKTEYNNQLSPGTFYTVGSEQTTPSVFAGVPLLASGTVTFGQPGYDPTTNNNGSVLIGSLGELTASPLAASSSSAGDLSFKHAGGYEAIIKTNGMGASPGSGNTYGGVGKANRLSRFEFIGDDHENGWSLSLRNSDIANQVEVLAQFAGTQSSVNAGGGLVGFNVQCGAHASDFPDGYTYDVVVSWPGDGIESHVQVVVNGQLLDNCSVTGNRTEGDFTGIIGSTITNGGSGYLSGGSGSSTVSYTGGGCSQEPAGATNVASGVITAVTISNGNHGEGCTSAPSAVFAGGGSGASSTTQLNPADITNTSTLTFGDYIETHWVGTMNYSGFTTYPNGITTTEAQQHFVATNYYRQFLPAKPTTPTPTLFANDFCSDTDGVEAMWVMLRLQQLGYINLGVISDEEADNAGPQWEQYAMARAGLANVPSDQDSSFGGGPYCGPAVASTTTAQARGRATYPTSLSDLRKFLAAAATSSVWMVDGGPPAAFGLLSSSTADSISSSTGPQLIAAKVKEFDCQCGTFPTGPGGNWANDNTNAGSLVNNWPTSTPFYANSLSPNFGPFAGACSIYASTSLEYQTWYWYNGPSMCAAGTDQRTPFDVLPIFNFLLPSWFLQSASGTITYNVGAGTDTWTSGAGKNMYYSTGFASIPPETESSFITSLLWSDPAYHFTR